ncbi:MAG TPA: hypothetical protein DCZ95_17225 [Verrucomicrobia bacterium]|nr:MAG: hypothetical protein A2X46_09705 [Lentisphaerae bacterium GWF2_57_35]HBA85827.1 hypothetical protein [Verrucomicrobiota bacterium]
MIIRVNLMHEADFRYQGAVSRGFIVKAVAITIAVLTGLFLLATVFQYKSLRQTAAWSQDRWNKIAPAYENVQAMQQTLNRNRTIMNELKGWQHSRIDWNVPLEELPRLVPSSIQLTKLNIFGSVEVKKTAAPAPKKAASSEKLSPVPEAAAAGPSFRKFMISIEGRSEDKMADKVILQFVDELRQGASFVPILDSVKLQGLRLETGRESSGRVFNIEATTLPREMK